MHSCHFGTNSTDISRVDLSHTSDVHVITGLLKLYFRELADPIFPEVLYNDFIRAARMPEAIVLFLLDVLMQGLPTT